MPRDLSRKILSLGLGSPIPSSLTMGFSLSTKAFQLKKKLYLSWLFMLWIRKLDTLIAFQIYFGQLLIWKLFVMQQISNKWPTWSIPWDSASNGQPKAHIPPLPPQSTLPTTYGPQIPSPQSSKTSWTKLPHSNFAYPINPTLIKTFTRIESMMFISQNVSSKCTINRSKMN